MDSEVDNQSGAKLIEIIKVGGMFTGFVILVLTWLAVRVLTATFERSGSRFAHRRLLLNQIATLLRFLLYFGGIAAAVGASINLSREVILALAGTVAVTIGFALKDLASSILAGVTIIVDRPFQVGDRVRFDPHYGEITSIGLRSVRILTHDNSLVTIPNNKFLTEAVASANHGNLDMLITMEFFVSPDQDLGLTKRIVEECMTSSRYIYPRKPWTVIMSQILCDSGTAVRLRAKGYVLDVKYEEEFASDVTERVLAAFREKNIALPGDAPPAEEPAGGQAPDPDSVPRRRRGEGDQAVSERAAPKGPVVAA
jgi:small-conductance mechanosensitive channel